MSEEIKVRCSALTPQLSKDVSLQSLSLSHLRIEKIDEAFIDRRSDKEISKGIEKCGEVDSNVDRKWDRSRVPTLHLPKEFRSGCFGGKPANGALGGSGGE